jgi:hypothetical protein
VQLENVSSDRHNDDGEPGKIIPGLQERNFKKEINII